MSAIFCPSVMCLKMDNLEKSIKELEDCGIDRFHLDLMDGVFVPNYSLGIQDIETVCRLSCKETELHLMAVNPGQYIRKFADLGVDIIYIHPESDYHPSSVIQMIMEAGMKPGIVLSPGTSVDSVRDLLRISKYVCVMTVNPGQAGLPFLPYVEKKILQVVKLKEEYGFELGLDGGCSSELIAKYFQIGVDSFVLGSWALFGKKVPYSETINNLRSIVGGNIALMSLQKKIKFFVTDVDGTLTDGKIYMGDSGEAMKAFDAKDGYALHELLPERGITPVLITGRESKIVENRAKELGVKLLFQGIKDKLAFLKKFASENSATPEEIAYMGDDVSDLGCIKFCEIGGCPADAANEVRQNAGYVSKNIAGSGAIRDFAEHIVRRQR